MNRIVGESVRIPLSNDRPVSMFSVITCTLLSCMSQGPRIIIPLSHAGMAKFYIVINGIAANNLSSKIVVHTVKDNILRHSICT